MNARRGRQALAALAAVALLGACDSTKLALTGISAATNLDLLDYFIGDENLMEKDYAAADYMAERSKGYVGKNHVIKALPLLDEDEPRLLTRFGREVPEQAGERLNELGYQVDLSEVTTAPDPNGGYARGASLGNPDFVLTGSYKRERLTVAVKLRIQDARTGVQRAGFSYEVRRKGNVRSGAKPEPSIQRIEDAPASPPTAPAIEVIPDSAMKGRK